MGGCFSSVDNTTSVSSKPTPPTAKVISVHGDLSEYPVPAAVSQILTDPRRHDSGQYSSADSDFFVCNADGLYYDQMIPELEMNHQLQPNHIYFLLPVSWLRRPLSPSHMADLAVKASVALRNSSNSKSNRPNQSRISPALLIPDDAAPIPSPNFCHDRITVGFRSSSGKNTSPSSSSSSSANISRSTSVKKLRRFTSSRAKMAARSFRLTLTPIYEGTVL